ncbi:hypothetical protein WA026_001326 [Henosepilachna vigintioctopunctata]|uniref:Peptidase S1 domain-containing protein n=1 Tax=Henosepilachna vigintioctopunctata TaxID=420089 RepID=A0AAW1URP0_9CUCU
MKIILFVCLNACAFITTRARSALITPQIMSRILNGRETDIRDHPYQVALVTSKNHEDRIVCGGALVKPTVIFTAAHCTHVDDNTLRPNLTVLVGANSLGDPKGKKHEIRRVIKHPDFTYDVFDNDFSVVVLNSPVQYNERAQPIDISEDDHLGGTKGIVSGWGLTEFNRPSENLRSVKLELEDWDKCQDHFPKPLHPTISKNHICVKPDERTTTYGDSGSPLVIDGKLVGIVSFGRMIDDSRKATVFSRVKSFVNFARNELDEFK